jgi:copper resistance protein B
MPTKQWMEVSRLNLSVYGGRAWATMVGMLLALPFLALLPTAGSAQVNDTQTYTYTILDRLEYGFQDGEELLLWEAQAWIGGDFNKLWFKAEGENQVDAQNGVAELQALWSHLISPFWDLQVGGRVDVFQDNGDEKARAFAVIGFEGLAPYWFEIEPALFVSQAGDVSFRLTGSYDMFLTQRLLIQGRVEGEVAAQAVPDFGVGSGLVGTETGVRVRYEIHRKFAPYVGWRWERRYGDTADLARSSGRDVAGGYLVSGVRIWF